MMASTSRTWASCSPRATSTLSPRRVSPLNDAGAAVRPRRVRPAAARRRRRCFKRCMGRAGWRGPSRKMLWRAARQRPLGRMRSASPSRRCGRCSPRRRWQQWRHPRRVRQRYAVRGGLRLRRQKRLLLLRPPPPHRCASMQPRPLPRLAATSMMMMMMMMTWAWRRQLSGVRLLDERERRRAERSAVSARKRARRRNGLPSSMQATMKSST